MKYLNQWNQSSECYTVQIRLKHSGYADDFPVPERRSSWFKFGRRYETVRRATQAANAMRKLYINYDVRIINYYTKYEIQGNAYAHRFVEPTTGRKPADVRVVQDNIVKRRWNTIREFLMGLF